MPDQAKVPECTGALCHCPHPTGSGLTHGWGGSDEFQCCLCGVLFMRSWTVTRRQIPGHGDKFLQRVVIYDDTKQERTA